jgi:hypothetical protein
VIRPKNPRSLFMKVTNQIISSTSSADSSSAYHGAVRRHHTVKQDARLEPRLILHWENRCEPAERMPRQRDAGEVRPAGEIAVLPRVESRQLSQHKSHVREANRNRKAQRVRVVSPVVGQMTSEDGLPQTAVRKFAAIGSCVWPMETAS